MAEVKIVNSWAKAPEGYVGPRIKGKTSFARLLKEAAGDSQKLSELLGCGK